MTELSSRYTSGEYRTRHPEWHGERAGWKAAQVARILDRHGVRPTSLVDVGCGTGGVLRELHRRYGCDMVGYEPSPDVPASDPVDGVDLRRGGLDAVEPGYDVLTMLDVFEHVDDYLGFLRATHGKAEWYVFHIPLDLSVQTVLRSGALPGIRERVGHLHYFTAETAIATLRDAGFDVVDHAYTGASFEGPGRSARQKLLALPRRLLAKVSPGLAARLLGGFALVVLAREG